MSEGEATHTARKAMITRLRREPDLRLCEAPGMPVITGPELLPNGLLLGVAMPISLTQMVSADCAGALAEYLADAAGRAVAMYRLLVPDEVAHAHATWPEWRQRPSSLAQQE